MAQAKHENRNRVCCESPLRSRNSGLLPAFGAALRVGLVLLGVFGGWFAAARLAHAAGLVLLQLVALQRSALRAQAQALERFVELFAGGLAGRTLLLGPTLHFFPAADEPLYVVAGPAQLVQQVLVGLVLGQLV